MAATIKDIAKKLNVSVSTVSYALNGGPRTVPEAVKARVLKAAEELDYRPNRLARSLVTRRMETIGIVFDRAMPDLILSPFRQCILNSILNALEKKKLDALLTTAADEDGQPQVERLLDGRVDGHIILSPLLDRKIVSSFNDRGLPYVTIAGGASFASDLSVDNARGIEIGLDYLMGIGHRKIAYIGGMDDQQDSIERGAAFRAQVERRGLCVPPKWQLVGGFTEVGGRQAAKDLLAHPPLPTAVFCANDESARGALRAFREAGVRVPQEISVLGFDDLPMSVELDIQLSTIRQPLEKMGEAAVSALLDLIEGQAPTSQRFEPALVKRGSTACPPENIHS